MACASFCISSQSNCSSVSGVQQCIPTRPQDAVLGCPVRGQATTAADLPALLGSLMFLSQQVPLGGSHAPATLLLSHLGLPGSDLCLHLLPTTATTERQYLQAPADDPLTPFMPSCLHAGRRSRTFQAVDQSCGRSSSTLLTSAMPQSAGRGGAP